MDRKYIKFLKPLEYMENSQIKKYRYSLKNLVKGKKSREKEKNKIKKEGFYLTLANKDTSR